MNYRERDADRALLTIIKEDGKVTWTLTDVPGKEDLTGKAQNISGVVLATINLIREYRPEVVIKNNDNLC